ncbi:HdeD family acid-resistance protein [Thiocapsa bogorovii]|uniref:HdeD family acid-resistance protein n=1 Tax=Thiocapsa bogorovii TaxID=521689 RepID=UPI001E3C549B|nr:HdeD family acid-resistance protein [Thiocapsa bogorovii]UHD17655.1 HdeD family acid-resistance protein [Thiocapsa bogorovii]
MANDQNTPVSQHPVFGDLSRNWGWLLAFGVLSIILGTVGMGMTFGLTLVSVVFFGALLIVGGTFQLIDAFKCQGWKGALWHILIALLYIAGGLLIVVDPVLASETLTLALAAVLIAVGLSRVIMAFQHRGQSGWGWLVLAGLISIALGAMIIAKWPMSGMWVIGLFVAIELIFNGWAYLFVALAARRAGKLSA